MAFCMQPEHQAAAASVGGDGAWVPGSLGNSNMIFVNLPGSLHRGQICGPDDSFRSTASFFSFLEKSGRRDFIPLSIFIRNSSEKMATLHAFLSNPKHVAEGAFIIQSYSSTQAESHRQGTMASLN